jgi:hypothetical protein
MSNAIEICKDIPAADIARAAGIKLKQNGRREWACCPFHGEKTPSLMFDAAGRFHCFGCGADGDGIDFYGRLYHIEDVKTAAERLAQLFNRSFDSSAKYTPPPRPPEVILKEKVDAWYDFEWGKACKARHRAQADMDAIQARMPSFNACWDSPAFCIALKTRSVADQRLDVLLESSLSDKVSMMSQEATDHVKRRDTR